MVAAPEVSAEGFGAAGDDVGDVDSKGLAKINGNPTGLSESSVDESNKPAGWAGTAAPEGGPEPLILPHLENANKEEG
jgi:hypothetical protein